MREYQQKRILGIFQSYDMNIDSYPNSSEEGKIQGCTQEKPMTRKNLCRKYQNKATSKLYLKNIERYRFFVLIYLLNILGSTTESSVKISVS